MSKSDVKFTVIIPVYNAAKYLQKCIESLIKQTHDNWEAIIIDDCSSDNSYEIIKSYSTVDKRISVQRNERNMGPGITRNKAIEKRISNNNLLSSDLINLNYFVFIDSDDWIDRNYLESIAKVAVEEKSEVIFVDVVQENPNGKFIKYQKASDYKGESKDTILRHQMTGKFPWGGVRKAVSTDLIQRKNIRYTDDINGEEAIYSFKLLYHTKSISFTENTYYHYVVRKNSQSSIRTENPYKDVIIKLKSTLNNLNEYKKYKNTYKSFVFTSIIISIYRVTTYHGIKKAYIYAKNELERFKIEYGFNLDKQSLEKRVRYLLPIAKFNFIFPIVFVSFIKKVISSK